MSSNNVYLYDYTKTGEKLTYNLILNQINILFDELKNKTSNNYKKIFNEINDLLKILQQTNNYNNVEINDK
jgi:hypothetical protein